MEWVIGAIVVVATGVFVAMSWGLTTAFDHEQEERDYIRRMMR